MAWPATPIPVTCPRCRKPLYPISTLRPKPRISLAGAVLVICGGAVAGAVFIGGTVFAYVRLRDTEMPELARLIGIALLVPAVLAGMPLVWLGHRLPRVLRLRCRPCGWSESFRTR
jgi:RNase P subunit RPR2